MIRIAVLLLLFAVPAALAQECLDCHATALDENRPTLTVSREAFERSIHGALGCSTCHSDVSEFPHGSVQMPQCNNCHSDQVTQYNSGIHGQSIQAGRQGAARCQDCHGPTHSILPVSDAASPASRQKVPETCGGCHANVTLMRQFGLPLMRPLERYSQSVHARALQQGQNGAHCGNCHGTHAIFPATDPRSSVFRFRVPETCGGCHAEIRRTYGESIHGQALSRGIAGAAVCTDCHGEHAILSPSDQASPVYAANVSSQACSRCHGDARLNEKYNLPADRVASYQESYHGLAARAGSLQVANCSSCHGVHNILPSADPRSTVAPANLPNTCGQCHPGAGTRFAIGPVHIVAAASANRAVYWIRWFYLILIPVTLGLMFAHNLLDFVKKVRRRFRAQQSRPLVLRMTRNERWQHYLLLSSFIVLVLTGFALKFPESFWARPIVAWEVHWPLRAWTHRMAAVVMIAAATLHLIHLTMDPAARRRWRKFLPRKGDWAELRERVAFNLGLRSKPPLLSEMSYVEKIEYWAVVWGTAIMTFTGLILWNNDLTLRHLTNWFLDVATVIHYYEAILAAAAIAVWHFYGVIFDPDHYPMDWTWITGTADAEHWLGHRKIATAATEDATEAHPGEPPPAESA